MKLPVAVAVHDVTEATPLAAAVVDRTPRHLCCIIIFIVVLVLSLVICAIAWMACLTYTFCYELPCQQPPRVCRVFNMQD